MSLVKKIQPEQPPSETRYVMLGKAENVGAEGNRSLVMGFTSMILLISGLMFGVYSTASWRPDLFGIMLLFVGLAALGFIEANKEPSIELISAYSYQSDEEPQVRAAIDKALEEMTK